MTAIARFEIEISCANVPDALQDIPLSVEIVSPNGSSQRTVIFLSPNKKTKHAVKDNGKYLIRAELPSGQWVADSVIVPNPAISDSSTHVKIVLDLGSPTVVPHDTVNIRTASTRESMNIEKHLMDEIVGKRLPTRFGFNSTFSQERTMGSNFQESDEGIGNQYFERKELESLSFQATQSTPDYGYLSYAFFSQWGQTPTPQDPAMTLGVVAQMTTAPPFVTVPGSVTLNDNTHPGVDPDGTLWRPLLMLAILPAKTPSGSEEKKLIAWPPSIAAQPLTLLLDPGSRQNSELSLLALSRSDDRIADALFAFIQGGNIDAVRETSSTLTHQATSFLYNKVQNPINAILAAYTLLKIGELEHQDWIANLANWFEYLPDGAIIYGWCLIRSGQAEKAPRYFATALTRGIPMYSEGVRLLRDGMNFLAGLYSKDEEIKAGAAHANLLADAANLDSELTCLNLNDRLKLTGLP